MPQATFKITGEITEFDRVDNLYVIMKREGAKLLKDWVIEVEASFTETEKK